MSKDRSASCLACFVRATTGGNAPSLKSVEEATSSRHKILYAFEVAERLSDPLQRRAWLTFVIVGAGATGVELAGAIGEIVPRDLALRRSFRVSRLLRPRRLSVASFRERALRPLAAPGPGVRGRSHVVLGDDRVSAPGDRHHGTDAVTFERYRADRVRKRRSGFRWNRHGSCRSRCSRSMLARVIRWRSHNRVDMHDSRTAHAAAADGGGRGGPARKAARRTKTCRGFDRPVAG